MQSVLQRQVVQTAINYTISQDFAAGFIAEQEKNLQGFLGNEQADPSAAQVATGPGVNQTVRDYQQTVRDYQMQLVLLEQQNKKRLLLARERSPTQYMAAMRKRPRSDTQAEQSYITSGFSPPSKKKQRNGAGGRATNTDLSEEMAQQAHGSSMTPINRDAAGHDDSDLSMKGMRNSKDQDHVLVMTSQIRSVCS